MAPTTPPQGQATKSQGNTGSNSENGSSHEPPAPLPSSMSSVSDHLAQALRDLARGEQTASTLEANLSSLESKLDEILASFGVSAADLDALDGEDGREQEEKQEKPSGDGKSAGEDGGKNGGA